MKNKTVRTVLDGAGVYLIYLNGKRGKGKFTIVDVADYTEEMAGCSWSLVGSGYARAWVSSNKVCSHCGSRISKGDGRTVYLHQLIMKAPDGMQTDHANRNRLDNRRSNLRLATLRQNSFNRKKRAAAGVTSRYKGVGWHKTTRKWQAHVNIDGKYTWLGSFHSEEDAARAYDAAVKELHGKFAVLNFPD